MWGLPTDLVKGYQVTADALLGDEFTISPLSLRISHGDCP